MKSETVQNSPFFAETTKRSREKRIAFSNFELVNKTKESSIDTTIPFGIGPFAKSIEFQFACRQSLNP